MWYLVKVEARCLYECPITRVLGLVKFRSAREQFRESRDLDFEPEKQNACGSEKFLQKILSFNAPNIIVSFPLRKNTYLFILLCLFHLDK